MERVERVWDGKYPLDRIGFRSRRYDGSMSRRRVWELWRRGPAVAVLLYAPATDEVALIEQIRLPALAAGLDPHMVELCAGLAEPGEAPDAVARREAREETGLAVGRTDYLGGALLSPGGSDEFCHVLVGEVTLPPVPPDGIIGHGGLADEAEDIRVHARPASAAIAGAREGRYRNAVTVIGLLWFEARREAIRAAWRAP